jgi:hypothetical protein
MAYEIVRQPVPGGFGTDLHELAVVGGPVAVLALLAALVVGARPRPTTRLTTGPVLGA